MSRISSARRALVGAHLILFALVWLAIGRFLQWDLSALPASALPLVCGAAAMSALAWAAARRPARFVAWLVVLAAVAVAWFGTGAAGAAAPTPGQAVYAIVVAAALGLLLQLVLRAMDFTVQGSEWVEPLRVVTLAAIALWLFQPYLTGAFFGGIDARSYAAGMTDVLTQVKAGVFPVFVGQTEFMFEGVIHPIRTAPYHQHLGMLLDVMTARSLPAVGVQHLTVVVTAIQAAIVCYLCLVSLAPRWRGLAWAMAVLYVSAPAVAGFIYSQEMYMTFMAFAWLPLVFLGNIRLIREEKWSAWLTLAAGLALVWFCHPPVGIWLTLCTALLQGLRLCGAQATWRAWKLAIAAALLFAGLAAYYFWSVHEAVATGQHMGASPTSEVIPLLVLVIALATLLRGFVTGGWRWLIPPAIATALLWENARADSLWIGAATLAGVLWVAAVPRRWQEKFQERRTEMAVVVIVAAGLLVLPWSVSPAKLAPFELVRNLFPMNFAPVSEPATVLSDLQVGYVLIAAWLVGVAALLVSRSLEVRLPVIVGLFWMLLFLPTPGITRFLLCHVPAPVSAISSVSLWLRYLPALIGLCAFTGFLGAVFWANRSARLGLILTTVFCAATVWSLLESAKFVRSGYRAVAGVGAHLDLHRPENVTQFAYIFAGVPLSPYLVNGVTDYHLESRLLKGDDPTAELGETVPSSAPAWESVSVAVDATNSSWLNLSPRLVLGPGEHWLLRFRFFDQPYNGVLIFRGPRGWYREYQLPAAGFGLKSFGVAPARPKTIALWNSSAEPQPVEMVFMRHTIPPDGQTPSDFAEIAMQRYDPATLPIRTEQLVPSFRATVTAKEPAYLETLRTFIPGYHATVNGRSRPVEASPNYKAMVKLEAGENRVELRYVGTKTLWAALVVSALTWLGLIFVALRSLLRRVASPANSAAA